jgi:hypothetical protein
VWPKRSMSTRLALAIFEAGIERCQAGTGPISMHPPQMPVEAAS